MKFPAPPQGERKSSIFLLPFKNDLQLITMGKSQDAKKEVKKKPAKTVKEKRAEKQEKNKNKNG